MSQSEITVSVLGDLWGPDGRLEPASFQVPMASLERADRESVYRWLLRHGGDFSKVADFEVSGAFSSPWEHAKSAHVFMQRMLGEDPTPTE